MRSTFREAIPHLHTIEPCELESKLRFPVTLTEKTDGQAVQILVNGWTDIQLRTAHSPWFSSSREMYSYAHQRFEDKADFRIFEPFAMLLDSFIFTGRQALDNGHKHWSDDLTTSFVISGDLIHRPNSYTSTVRPVLTSYDAENCGPLGMVLFHSQTVMSQTESAIARFRRFQDLNKMYKLWSDRWGWFHFSGTEELTSWLEKWEKREEFLWGSESEGIVLHFGDGTKAKYIHPRWTEEYNERKRQIQLS